MKEFNILKYKSIFWEPNIIKYPASWVEHIPFAFFLIEILKPSLYVELGTHSGNSYNAFCQAIKTIGVGTKCYAVDKWEGDDHAGFYSDDIYSELYEYQDKNYRTFSQLMRMSFDDAFPYFDDGSIDLLHIDGLHTYEAVKHDFETWLSKLSNKGVIIFHDTAVRRDDFGVWKLWEELSTKYPSYNFNHGYGLGILAVGTDVPQEFIEFLESINNDVNIDALFCRLGSYIFCKNSKENYQNQFEKVRREINTIKSSIGWKMGNKMVDVLRFFIPKNSFRERILKRLFYKN